MHYAADTTLAFNSVEKIMRDVNSGWLLRYMHANGASFFFIAVYIHISRGLYYGSYKAPREILWILGCIIYLLMMATGFMGYVLPWGQMSFWGATVITGFFTAIPLVGDWIQQLLLGGFAVDNPTLNRFFSLHYLLPFMIAGVVDPAHLGAARRRPDQSDRHRSEVEDGHRGLHALRDRQGRARRCRCSCSSSPISSSTCRTISAIRTTTSIADPLKTPAHIVPEWYFLPFYAILRAITFNIGPINSKLGGVLAMFGAIVVLFFVPWLDTSKVRSAVYRPWYRLFFWLFVANAIFLGWLGSRPAEGALRRHVAARRRSTISRFFLVIMPVLGLIETPTPAAELDHRSGAGEEQGVAQASQPALPRRRKPKAEGPRTMKKTFDNRILSFAAVAGLGAGRRAGRGRRRRKRATARPSRRTSRSTSREQEEWTFAGPFGTL